MTTANSWSMSRQIVLDGNGEPVPGALAYFYDGGTTAPRTVYQDSALATPHEWPVEADAYGRFPRVFLQFGDFDEKVTTDGGTQLWYDQNIGNTDPVDTSVSVDADALLSTGDVWWSPINATRSGAVRLNGRTIGSAASGASERANNDTEDLYRWLWNALSNTAAPVTGGRGATAAADFAANKPLQVPDLRGSLPLGLDTMGAGGADRLDSAPVTSGDTDTAGSVLGANTHTLTSTELAAHTHALTAASAASGGAHTHSGTTGTESATHTHAVSGTTGGQSADHYHGGIYQAASLISVAGPGAGIYVGNGTTTNSGYTSNDHTHSFSVTSGNASATHTHTFSISSSGAHTHTLSGTTDSEGGGGAHNNVQRAVLGTWFIKL